MMEHTPGPWVAGDNEQGDYTVWQGEVGDVGDVLAVVEKEVNAHLIAAAPDMYEALIGIVADLENVVHPDVLEATLEAIAKAKP